MTKNIFITLLVLILIIAVFIWFGMKHTPQAFNPYPHDSHKLGTFLLPDDLPQPVERFYRTVYGEEIPVIRSFILDGRGQIRF